MQEQNRTDPEQQNLFLPSRACFYYSHSLVVISFPSLNRNTTRSSAWTVTWSTVPFQSFSSKVSGRAVSSPNSNIMPPMAMAYCRSWDSQWQGRRVIRKLSFTKFPYKTKVHRNLTSPAHNYGLLRLDYDEIFKVSLLIWQNLLESAKRLCLTLHIEHQYHLIHQRAIRISKQNTKVQTAKTDCAIA